MEKRILAIGGSNSQQSINRTLASWAAGQLSQKAVIQVPDLNEYEMPIYSIERQKESGIHPLAISFRKHIQETDGIILSLAEHNGSYSVAFKNILDWMSREDRNIWADKPMLLMATSPGGRGGKTVLTAAATSLPHMGASVTSTFSLPGYHKNFSTEKGIIDSALATSFQEALQAFELAVWEQD